jgi:acetyl-CoA carboxylase biotin carboxyl carrier protein
MDLDAVVLKTLVDIMRRDGLDRLRIRVGGVDVDLRMSLPQTAQVVAQSVREPSPGTHPASSASSARGQEAPPNVRKVLAPLVGVFYLAPAPGAKQFVQLGDAVTGGQVLCILEAMKLMNEIVSEFDGKVVKICVDDGALVSLNQDLFWIET